MSSEYRIHYRADIDGLRAIAVMMVVLFHAGLGFSGGYVGVDVFFVISGFLITGIISRELEEGRFSFVHFWERRMRRILPPLFVMVLFTILAGWLLLLPSDLKDLARSAISQSVLVANVYFWRTTGYFDGPAEMKPLLHLWSLAVEEQFYLIFPIAMFLITRFSRQLTFYALIFFTIISLTASISLTKNHPSACYFLLPTRAWELSLGSVLAFLNEPFLKYGKVSAICCCTGLIAIFYAGLTFDESTVFPGAAAILPCGGTALVIVAGSTKNSLPNRMLGHPMFVGIGLISYSLYLWHWPILVYCRYWVFEEFSLYVRVTLVVISVFIAWISWRFVETQFRAPKWSCNVSEAVAIKYGILSCISLGLLSSVFTVANIQPWLPQQAVTYASAASDPHYAIEVEPDAAKRGSFPLYGDKRKKDIDLLVWGDSHAIALMPLIDLMSKEHGACTAVATHSSTAPLTDFVWETKYGLGKDTPEFANATIDYVQKNRIRHVLLAGIWCGYGNVSESGQTEGKLLVCLKRTIELLRIAGADVTIMLEVPCQNSLATPRILARQSFLRRDVDEIGITRLHHLSRVKETNDQIRDVVGSEATILDPAEYLINQNGFCSAQKNGKSRYRDNHHLTAAGAMELRPLFQPLFDAITETNLEKIENEFPLSNMPRALDR